MKQFIIMTAMIMLGVLIFNMIAGDGESSLINVLEKVFRNEIESRAEFER